MPATKRRIDLGLIDQLREEPYRFEFFQAVRLLLAHYRNHGEGKQDLDILGQVVRFRNSVSLGFPASEIEALEFEVPTADDAAEADIENASLATNVIRAGHVEQHGWRRVGKVTLTPAFIGLTGPMGVMPRHYTHYVADREIHHRDTATRAFLDIFASRAIALFYQTWLKYRLHLQYESDRKHHFLPLVLSLAGLGLPGLQQRLQEEDEGIADESLAYYVGALRQRPQSVQWLARVVADYFRVVCRAEQFVGQWFALPHSERSMLGGANCELGVSTFCGSRIWDRTSRVRLLIGPLRISQFEDFLPGRRDAASLEKLFRLMLGSSHDCEVRLILDRRDLVRVSLDSRNGAARLGWNGWLGARSEQRDSDEVAYLIGVGNT